MKSQKSSQAVPAANKIINDAIAEVCDYLGVKDRAGEISYYAAFGAYIIDKDIFDRLDTMIAENIVNAFVVLIVVFGFYLSFRLTGISYFFFDYQAYAAFACLPLLLYNGKRGYDKKWFKYGAYLYIPLHIFIIFIIFTLI